MILWQEHSAGYKREALTMIDGLGGHLDIEGDGVAMLKR